MSVKRTWKRTVDLPLSILLKSHDRDLAWYKVQGEMLCTCGHKGGSHMGLGTDVCMDCHNTCMQFVPANAADLETLEHYWDDVPIEAAAQPNAAK
jgi:hypothetical protein